MIVLVVHVVAAVFVVFVFCTGKIKNKQLCVKIVLCTVYGGWYVQVTIQYIHVTVNTKWYSYTVSVFMLLHYFLFFVGSVVDSSWCDLQCRSKIT